VPPTSRSTAAIRRARLESQQIARHDFATPADVVAWLGAVQAQDYLACLWAIGVRLPGSTAETVERAISDGSIIRTHVFRGTIQLVTPADLPWMLDLVGARLDRAATTRYRSVGLDEATLDRARAAIADAVAGSQHKTRHELGAALRTAGIATDGQRLIYTIFHAEVTRVICSGIKRDKQLAFAAYGERISVGEPIERAAAVAELVRRFFRSRSPARVRDCVWWTGLPLSEIRAGIAAQAGDLAAAPPSDDGTAGSPNDAHLLPAFDEYFIGYADRGEIVDPAHVARVNAGGGMLKPIVVVDGRIVGIWKRTFARRRMAIDIAPFAAIARRDRARIDDAAVRYAAFVDTPIERITGY
jgi:hypothetical protein